MLYFQFIFKTRSILFLHLILIVKFKIIINYLIYFLQLVSNLYLNLIIFCQAITTLLIILISSFISYFSYFSFG